MFILDGIDITSLLQAFEVLQQFYKATETEQERAGTIQAFEFCYELTWKTMKRILKKRGIDVLSPRETFRIAAKEGLIADTKLWFDFIELRNKTVHTYDQNVAEAVFRGIPLFITTTETFIQTIKTL